MGKSALATTDRFYGRLSAALFIALTVVVLYTFSDYGASWDEEGQHLYGGAVFRFLSSLGADRSAVSISDNLNLYGGFFEVLSYIGTRISPLGVHETRHLLSALCGIIGILGCWKLAQLLAGARAAFWAAFLLSVYPSYYGHMFINSKDIPFAALYVWSLYYLVRVLLEFPSISLKTAAKLGVVTGFAMGVRVGGLLLLCYFYFFTVLRIATSGALRQTIRRTLGCWAVTTLIAYGTMLMFWPYALIKPLQRPFTALAFFSHYNNGASPRDWVLRHFVFKLPEHVLMLLVIGAVAGIGMLLTQKVAPRTFPYFLVIVSASFPIAYAFVEQVYVYDEIRHFLFVIPPLFCLVGMTCDCLAAWVARKQAVSRIVAVAAVIYFFTSVGELARLHPYEYVYYNRLVGGLPGAHRKGYETEYWATSYRESVQELERFLRARDGSAFGSKVYKVFVKPPEFAATYYFPQNFLQASAPEGAEFFLSTTRYGATGPANSQRVVEVHRSEVSFAFVDDLRSKGGR